MEVSPVVSPSSRQRQPRSTHGRHLSCCSVSPRRRPNSSAASIKRSPRRAGILCSPTLQQPLRSPAQIDSPGSAANYTLLLFPDSPHLGGTIAEMRASPQMPATAPPADRRSKRFDMSHWQHEIDNIAVPATAAPAPKASLFPVIASFPSRLDLGIHPASEPLPSAPLAGSSQMRVSSATHHGRTFSLSTAKLDDDDSDSPFRVASTTRRANSLKHQRISPEVQIVPHSASHGTLSTAASPCPFTKSSLSLSTSTSGAKLEALTEDNAQYSFAPREPLLEQPIFRPLMNSSAGPSRSRAGSVSRIPVAAHRTNESMNRARKATSMMDLAKASAGQAMQALSSITASRKRNANGALVGGGGARSRLAAASPVGPPGSTSPTSSSPSAHAMRDVAAQSDGDEDQDSTAKTAVPRSRSQALPLHMRFSEPLPKTNPLLTPAACKIARPLQTAFLSTGLLSKKARASDPTTGGSPAIGLPFALKASDSRQMPLTPCKRPSLLSIVVSGGATVPPSTRSPLSPHSNIPRPLMRTHSSSSTSSAGSEASPTAVKVAALPSRRVSPLMRRRSSGNLRDVGDVEPQTPTRISPDSMALDHNQLATTPTSRISPPKTPWPPAPVVCVPNRGQLSPLTPFHPRASHPPPANARPVFKARHSNSALLTLRQRELSTPDRFEGQFSVIRELGKGESSEAFALRDRETGNVSAVKRTKLPYGGPKDRTRRLEEVDALRALAGGPHIVHFYDAWEQNGHLFIQTELCDGGTLAYFLDRFGCEHERLPEACVWKVLAEVSAGLTHIHAMGFLHLDLKPANIFLTSEGSCRIGDFGLATRWPRQSPLDIIRNAGLEHPGWDATVWDQAEVAAGNVSTLERRHRIKSAPEAANIFGFELEREGDREYIAPEILSGQYGREADMFSIGLIALEAATNVVLPDNGESWRKLRDGDLSDVELAPLSVDLVALLHSLLRPQAPDRLNAAQLAQHPFLKTVREMRNVRSAIVDEAPDFLDRVVVAVKMCHPPAADWDAMDVDSA